MKKILYDNKLDYGVVGACTSLLTTPDKNGLTERLYVGDLVEVKLDNYLLNGGTVVSNNGDEFIMSLKGYCFSGKYNKSIEYVRRISSYKERKNGELLSGDLSVHKEPDRTITITVTDEDYYSLGLNKDATDEEIISVIQDLMGCEFARRYSEVKAQNTVYESCLLKAVSVFGKTFSEDIVKGLFINYGCSKEIFEEKKE